MIAYCIEGRPKGFTRNANVWQKLEMFDSPNESIVVDMSKGEKAPKDVSLFCFGTMGFGQLLRMCLYRIFCPCRNYAMLFWDPPGMFRRDSDALRDVIQCLLMDMMLEFAARGAEKLVWNLHPGFAQEHYSKVVMQKSSFFPNGTLVAFNQEVVKGVARVRKRIAISSAFRANKGCWEIVDLLVSLWKCDHEISFIWVGYPGLEEEVKERFRKAGVPEPNMHIPGYVPLEDSLRLLASADVALNFYKDLPSVRWNYVLKAPEFMSLGIPVVSPNLPGVAEYVKDGETGLLFRPGNVDEAFEKVLSLLRDPVRVDKMRKICLSSVARYDWSVINSEIMKELNK